MAQALVSYSAANIGLLLIYLESRLYCLPPFAIPSLCKLLVKEKIMLRAGNNAAYEGMDCALNESL